MNLTKKYKNLLNNLKENPNIITIIIFGSYSNNSFNKNSDLDIALIFKKNLSKNKKIEILSNGNNEFDLNDFFSMPLSLQYKIINFGKIHTNKIDLNQIKKIVRHEYFDFKPILNKIYKSKNLLPI